MAEVTGIGTATAFAAGIVSFLSPCVLPIVPAYLSYVAAQTTWHRRLTVRRRMATLGISAFFVAGFSTVFVAFGAGATALGELFSRYRYQLNIVGGAIIVLFGVFMLGLLRTTWLQRDVRFHPHIVGGNPLAAYILGLAFGFGWTPCIGPVLGAILTVTAAATGAKGMTLLAAYALGLGVPFLVAALFLDRAADTLRRLRKLGQVLQVVGGVVMIVFGVAMILGYVSTFAIWLLQTFPALGRIG